MNKIETLLQEWQSQYPLKEDDQTRLDRMFMLEFNYNSNHIEGNTLTYGQTELLLLFGRVVGEAKMKDLEEMKAHNVCLKMTIEEAKEKDKPLTEYFIRTLHQTMLREDYTVYRQLPGGETTSYVVHAGCYKTRPNSVITPTGERFEYASPEETPALMADLVSWYNSAEAEGELSPIELAALFHYRYIRIHPFEDGNGRVARLLMNYILLRHGYPQIVIRSKNKKTYLEALGRADKNVGPVPSDGANATLEQAGDFVSYITKQVEDTLETNLDFLREKADSVWWFDGEFVKFKNAKTITILKAMISNSKITTKLLMDLIGVSATYIQRQITDLQKKQYVVRIGGRKNGEWKVNLIQTYGKSNL
jgi:Fic family protein